MVPLGLIKFEFIPASDNGQVAVTVEMPPGSSLEATENVLQGDQRRAWPTIPEIEYYLAASGQGGGSGFGVGGSGVRFGRIQVVLVRPLKERHRVEQPGRRRDHGADQGHPGRHDPRLDVRRRRRLGAADPGA